MGLFTSSVGEDGGPREHTHIAGGTTLWYYPYDSLWEYLPKLSTGTLTVQQFHLGIRPRGISAYVYNDARTRIFKQHYYKIPKLERKKPKCPSKEKDIL